MSNHEFSPPPEVEYGVYRHYKGGLYDVYDLTCDEETGQWRVSYRALYDTPEGMPTQWSRNVTVFFEEVSLAGLRVKRFEKVENEG